MEEEESNLYRDAFLEGFTAQIEQLEIEKQVLKTKFSTDFWASLLSAGGAMGIVWKFPETYPSLAELAAIGSIGLVTISISKLINLVNYAHELRGKERAVVVYERSRERMEERFFPEGRRI